MRINELARMAMRVAGRRLDERRIPGLPGVRGRGSDNGLIREELGWALFRLPDAGLTAMRRWMMRHVRQEQLGRSAWRVLRVPFPYAERDTRQQLPAELETRTGFFWS